MSLTKSPSVKTYKAYAEALNARDIDRARAYLHDDLTYQGPVGKTQGADAYLNEVSAIGLHQEVRKILVDGRRRLRTCRSLHRQSPRRKTLRLRMVSGQRRQDRLDSHYF